MSCCPAPPTEEPENICPPGTKLESGNVLDGGGANDGGDWYAAPGNAPFAVFRKKASHDYKNNHKNEVRKHHLIKN